MRNLRRDAGLRAAGRGFVAAAGAGLAIVPWRTDIDRHRTFAPGWAAHARLHGTAGVPSSTAEGGPVAGPAVRGDGRLVEVAAALPLPHWLPFNVAAIVPGTSVDEVDRPVPRVAGAVPVNLLAQNVLAALAAVGWVLYRRGASAARA